MKAFILALFLTISPCLAQEISEPDLESPVYVLEETTFENREYNFSEYSNSSRNMYVENYDPVLSSESLEEILRRRSRFAEEFRGCILSPIAIDDYYIGCYFTFDPNTEDHRIDIWE